MGDREDRRAHFGFPANFVDWQTQSDSLTHVAAVRSWDGNLTGADEPERIQGALATADLFEVLGVSDEPLQATRIKRADHA